MALSVSGFPEPSSRGGELVLGDSDSGKLMGSSPRLRGLFGASSSNQSIVVIEPTSRPLPSIPGHHTPVPPKISVSAPTTPLLPAPISKVIIHAPAPQHSFSMRYQPLVVGADDTTTSRPLPQLPSPITSYRTPPLHHPSSSSPSPSRSPQPIRPSLPLPSSSSSRAPHGYKRARTSSQGFVSGSGISNPTTSTHPTHYSPIPISWAATPVDLNSQRPVGATGPNPSSGGSSAMISGYKSTAPYPRFSTAVPSNPRRNMSNTIATSMSVHIPPPPSSASISTPGFTSSSGSGSASTSAFNSGSGSGSGSGAISAFASGSSPPSSIKSPHSLSRSRSHSGPMHGIRKEKSLDGFFYLNQNSNTTTNANAHARMRMTVTPPPSQPLHPHSSSSAHSHVPLGLSFSRLASVSGPPPSTMTQSQGQSGTWIGRRERRDIVRGNDVSAAPGTTNADNNNNNSNTNRPTFRPLHVPSNSYSVSSSYHATRLANPITGANTNKTAMSRPPKNAATASDSDVMVRPSIVGGPRSAGSGQRQKLQLSLQIPDTPMLKVIPQQQVQSQESVQERNKLPVLTLITNTHASPIDEQASAAAADCSTSVPSPSPSIRVSQSPSPTSPSTLSYMSYSHSPSSAHSNPNPNPISSSPIQLSPTHSSLFSADSRVHLHPLSLSSPISVGTAGTGTSGSASARTSVSIRGWRWTGRGGSGGGGGASPGGRSVRSTRSAGGKRARSVRSNRSGRSVRSNKSRRSRISVKSIQNPISIPTPTSIPDPISSPTTATISQESSSAYYNSNNNTYPYIDVSGDQGGECLVYSGDGGYGYVEDGWGGGRSPSPIRYARPDSRGNLSSDTEDEGGRRRDRGGMFGDKTPGEGEADDSGASSEVEFAVDPDCGDDEDDDDDDDFGMQVMRRNRKWNDMTRRRGDTIRATAMITTTTDSSKDNLTTTTTTASSSALSHSHSPSASPLSSSSANSYSNPYSTRKDRKRARKTQLRSFRYSYRMPPSITLEQERDLGGQGQSQARSQEGRAKGRQGQLGASSPVTMFHFRSKKTPGVDEQQRKEQVVIEVENAASVISKKKDEGTKVKEKDGKKGKAQVQPKKKPSKSAKDYFSSVSASVSATYSQSQSQSQSQSGSASASVPNTRASSPERGRKPHVTTTRKTRKFAEAVSLALEEVTSRGRSGGGGATSVSGRQSPTPLRQQSSTAKTKVSNPTSSLITYTTTTTTTSMGMTAPVPSPLPMVFQPHLVNPYGHHHHSGSIPFDEMEVLDISLPAGEDGGGSVYLHLDGGDADVDVNSVEVEAEMEQLKQKGQEMMMVMAGGGTSSSLPESGQLSTVYTSDGGGSRVGGTAILPSGGKQLPAFNVPLISEPPFLSSLQQKRRQTASKLPPRRGSSLGREGHTSVLTSNTISLGGINNKRQYHQYQQQQQYPYRNTQFQLQPAYTTGISCGLSVSRPPTGTTTTNRSRPPLPLPPLPRSAPSSASATTSQFVSAAAAASSAPTSHLSTFGS